MILKEWPPDVGIEETDMSKTPFWVQLHGFPLSNASLENIKMIGEHMGRLVEIKPIPFGIARNKFVRIRVELEDQTLKTRFLIPRRNKESAQISFKYEK